MERIKGRYLLRLQEEKAACEARRESYAAAGSGDDANLEKIRLNIIGIFATLADATRPAAGEDPRESYCRAYLNRFETIPASWRQRLAEAREHGDGAAAALETLKLETAERLRGFFVEEMEAENDGA